MSIRINPLTVEGQQKLNSLPDNLKAWGLTVLAENAELIAGLAQVYVRVKTGKARDSIHTEKTENAVSVVAGGSTAPHVVHLEQRYPFMRPAFEQVKPQIATQLKTFIEGKANE